MNFSSICCDLSKPVLSTIINHSTAKRVFCDSRLLREGKTFGRFKIWRIQKAFSLNTNLLLTYSNSRRTIQRMHFYLTQEFAWQSEPIRVMHQQHRNNIHRIYCTIRFFTISISLPASFMNLLTIRYIVHHVNQTVWLRPENQFRNELRVL